MIKNIGNYKTTFFILILFICSCTSKPKVFLEEKIISVAKLCINDKSCSVDLKEITSFKWDSLFVFYEYDDCEYISKIISLKYSGKDVPDGKMRMLFTKGKSLVYEEDFGGITYKESHVYLFMPIDSGSYSLEKHAYTKTLFAISANQSKFVIKKTKQPSDCDSCYYYYLSPVIDIGKKLIASG